jgi:hypothetical protein
MPDRDPTTKPIVPHTFFTHWNRTGNSRKLNTSMVTKKWFGKRQSQLLIKVCEKKNWQKKHLEKKDLTSE